MSVVGETPLTCFSEFGTGVICAGKISRKSTLCAVVPPPDTSIVNVALSPACAVDGLTFLLTVIVGSITVIAVE